MTKDNRDPKALGEKLLYAAQHRRAHGDHTKSLSFVADHAPIGVSDYPDETTLDKYGDPREIPHD